MKTVKASWMALAASAAYVAGRISEAECRRRINAARALIGRAPMAGSPPHD